MCLHLNANEPVQPTASNQLITRCLDGCHSRLSSKQIQNKVPKQMRNRQGKKLEGSSFETVPIIVENLLQQFLALRVDPRFNKNCQTLRQQNQASGDHSTFSPCLTYRLSLCRHVPNSMIRCNGLCWTWTTTPTSHWPEFTANVITILLQKRLKFRGRNLFGCVLSSHNVRSSNSKSDLVPPKPTFPGWAAGWIEESKIEQQKP